MKYQYRKKFLHLIIGKKRKKIYCCPGRDLNPGPLAHDSTALPIELSRPSFKKLEYSGKRFKRYTINLYQTTIFTQRACKCQSSRAYLPYFSSSSVILSRIKELDTLALLRHLKTIFIYEQKSITLYKCALAWPSIVTWYVLPLSLLNPY